MRFAPCVELRAPQRAGAFMVMVWLGLFVALPAAPAEAAVPPSLHDPANCEVVEPGPGLAVHVCDDGTPPTGGRVPNIGGNSAITVPARYQGYIELPPKAPGAAFEEGADPDGNIAVDVNVTLPTEPPGPGGYPVIYFLHGCCGGSKSSWFSDTVDGPGKQWHYSTTWFASRGYVVISQTARGFINGNKRGSTGETGLMNRALEINDFQSVTCQVLGSISEFEDVTGAPIPVDPSRMAITSGSYGSGFTWLAMTDPKWGCGEAGHPGLDVSLVAVAPLYGWTDLANALAPTGNHSPDRHELPATDGCSSGPVRLDGSPCPAGSAPLGVPKTTVVGGLYGTGNNVTGNHTTFPESLDQAFVCLQGSYPPPPGCEELLTETLVAFLREHSAYYQNRFFNLIRSDPTYRVPIFSATAHTDPLFPMIEHRRMTNRLQATVPNYPIQIYAGDYQHFTQDKTASWADVCGSREEICTVEDYPVLNGSGGKPDFDRDPAGLVRTGIMTRLNRFLDHYAKPSANPAEPRPRFDVTAELQICPQTATEEYPAGAAGPQFTADRYEDLTRRDLDLDLTGARATTSTASPNDHALSADPLINQISNGNSCVAVSGDAGAGVATYETEPLQGRATMIGATRVFVEFEPQANSSLQLNARLYDVLPDGTAVMADRGTHLLRDEEAQAGIASFYLRGNGWRFEPGHRIRVEIAQDDSPHVKATTIPSSMTLSKAELRMPIRELERGRCANRISGNRLDERFRGSRRGDGIRAKRGADTVRGRSGSDCLNGGPGRDRVTGAEGDDKVTGGRGRDVVRGGRGNDNLTGGRGPDTLRAGGGDDTVKADDGQGGDDIDCGGGNDIALVDPGDKVRGCENVRRG